MPTVQDQIAQARAAGYSDSEITAKLATLPGYADKIKTATSAGYAPSDIVSHLSGASTNAAPAHAATSADIPATAPGGIGSSRSQHDIDRARELAAPDRTYHDDNLIGKAFGPVDAGLTVASSMGLGAVAPIVGFAKAALNPNSAKQPQEYASEFAEANQYQPRTGTGAQLAGLAGKVAAPLGALPSAALLEGAQAIGSGSTALRGLAGANAGAMAAQDAAAAAGATKLRDLVNQRRASMSGVGAAETDAAAMRMQTAANLPVPPKLTRSQATRNFADIQFEREKAKIGKEGAPLRARFDEQNKNLGQNMDAFIDETGASAANDRAIGTTVVNAVEQRQDALKANIDGQYALAREQGEMNDPINIRPLMQYLEENRTSAEVAPILNSIEKALGKKSAQVPAQMGGEGVVKADPLNRTISLNDLEGVRQQIYAEIEHGTPGEVKGLAMRDLIDQATDGKGGPLYQQARRSFENYANEFKNRGVISKLLDTKPGTNDRAVAFEDVLDHLTGSGASLDDVRAVRRTLQSAGDEGAQAWREVQGGILKKIKREVYSGVSGDESGASIASPAKLNKAVENLDLDGKLDFIYGKAGAQRLRDLNEHSKTILTTPPGAVNYSNSSAAILAALAADFPVSAMTGVPAPVVTALTYGAKGAKSKLLQRKIQSHLDYQPSPVEQRVDLVRQTQADQAASAAVNAQAQSNLRARVDAARQQKAAAIAGAQTVDEAIKAFSRPADQP